MSGSCNVAGGNKKKYMHVIIMFVLGAIVSILPPVGQITPMGMDVLAVFVMLVYGWIFVDLLWSSILGFFLLALTGATNMTAAFTACFSNYTVIVSLVCITLASAMSELGITGAISNFMLSRKFIVGRPWAFIAMLVTLSFVLSLVGQGMVGCILLWSIVINILKSCGYEEQSPLMSFMLCMIFFATMVPMYVAPWQPMILMFSAFYQIGTPIVHPYAQYFVVGIILYAVTFLIMILLAKFVFRIDASKFNISEEMRLDFASRKVSTVTKAALIGLAIFVVVLIVPEFLPQVPGMAALKTIGVLGWAVVYMSVFGMWLDKETGKPALDIQKAFSSISWSMILLMGVTLPLGSALESAEVGIMATVTQIVTPLTSGFSVTGFYIFCFVLLGVLTQVLHNMVLGVVFLPLFGTVGVAMGCNPYILFFMCFVALNTAYATPAGCSGCGLLYGNTSIKKSHTYLWGLLLITIVLIVGIAMMPLFNAML